MFVSSVLDDKIYSNCNGDYVSIRSLILNQPFIQIHYYWMLNKLSKAIVFWRVWFIAGYTKDSVSVKSRGSSIDGQIETKVPFDLDSLRYFWIFVKYRNFVNGKDITTRFGNLQCRNSPRFFFRTLVSSNKGTKTVNWQV